MSSESEARWKEHAYPLKHITIEIQATRHFDIESMIKELDEIKVKLMEGCTSGLHHDDDSGYRFGVLESKTESIFGTEPCGGRWSNRTFVRDVRGVKDINPKD
jgi:hypothetical protein